MATTIIPTEEVSIDGALYFTVDLDGVNYQLVFQYNQREGFGYYDILDIEDNPIRTGIKFVSNWPLLRLMQNTPRPPGELITIDTRNRPLDPVLDEIGTLVLLGYEEQDSLP